MDSLQPQNMVSPQPDWGALLTWFDSVKRDLPWRGTEDPYAILVSELMLQQTQVQTVLPYYLRFLERFPNLQTLAEAEEEEVLRSWSGLGYYRRGQSLHRAARKIMTEHHGAIPSDKAALLSLPGIGEYTAGAILSIAYHQVVPWWMETSRGFSRVSSRWIKTFPRSLGKGPSGNLRRNSFPPLVPDVITRRSWRLGAMVCLPTQPKCLECPLADFCRAHQQGATSDFPVKSRQIRREKFHEAVLLVECEGYWLLTSRNDEGLYAGLWQFPWAWKHEQPRNKRAVSSPGPSPSSWATWSSAFQSLTDTIGLSFQSAKEVGTARHAVTFRSIQTTFFLLQGVSLGRFSRDLYRWVQTESLAREALPSYQKKALALLHTLRVPDQS